MTDVGWTILVGRGPDAAEEALAALARGGRPRHRHGPAGHDAADLRTAALEGWDGAQPPWPFGLSRPRRVGRRAPVRRDRPRPRRRTGHAGRGEPGADGGAVRLPRRGRGLPRRALRAGHRRRLRGVVDLPSAHGAASADRHGHRLLPALELLEFPAPRRRRSGRQRAPFAGCGRPPATSGTAAPRTRSSARSRSARSAADSGYGVVSTRMPIAAASARNSSPSWRGRA